MDFIKQHRVTLAVLVVIVALIGVGIAINMSQQSADDTKKKEETAKQQKQKEAAKKEAEAEREAAKKEAASKSYSYTTSVGDSYTALARQSVQDYAKANGVELSHAQVIAAETTLTQQAGAPVLDVDQTVTLKNADVKKAVDGAKNLDAASLAAWEAYVPYVVFA